MVRNYHAQIQLIWPTLILFSIVCPLYNYQKYFYLIKKARIFSFGKQLFSGIKTKKCWGKKS